MAPTPSTLISSGSKKKEPRYLRLSEAKASHKICTEVSSSVPHFLQVGSLLSPITCRCLLRVLCPVSGPITALVCVLLKDSQLWLVVRPAILKEMTSDTCSYLFLQSFFLCFVDCAAWYICVIKTNLMHYLSSVYFVSQPLHVLGIFVAHHQEYNTYQLLYIYIYTVYLLMVGYKCAQNM